MNMSALKIFQRSPGMEVTYFLLKDWNSLHCPLSLEPRPGADYWSAITITITITGEKEKFDYWTITTLMITRSNDYDL